MKTRLAAMWKQLSTREQYLLFITGLLLGMVCVYYFIQLPVKLLVQTRRMQYLEAQHTLVWMQDVKPLLAKKLTVKHLNSTHLLTEFSNQLKQASLKKWPYQLQQVGTDAIQLTFENVSYVMFMTWLHDLSQRYAFTIQTLELSRTSTPGIVKLVLVIKALI